LTLLERHLQNIARSAVRAVQMDRLLGACDWQQFLRQPLGDYDSVRVVGMGKAALAMASVLERQLADTPCAGVVVVPHGYAATLPEGFERPRRIEVLEAEPFVELVHEYPERQVTLDVWRVTRYAGEPHGREQQELRWVSIAELATIGLLPADLPIIAALERLS